jgi:nucleotide-binding universal stress UspA family protein
MDLPLLLPFDGSPAAQRAADLLAAYGGGARLAVTLLNVQSRPVSLWPDASIAGTLEEALLEDGEEALRRALERLPQAAKAVRLGFPAEVIVQEAAAGRVAAVVMGTRGAGALHGFALGSVALRVAHAAPVPTLLLKPEARLPGAFGKSLRVLLAMDGSEPAQRAARQLVAWRDWLGTLEVHLVHVQQPLTLLQTLLPPHRDVIEQWSSRAGEEASEAARALFVEAGITHRLHLTVGDPAREIGLLAEQTGSEIVALGTRGLGAAHHAFVGSVALKAAALSEVPVLLVR